MIDGVMVAENDRPFAETLAAIRFFPYRVEHLAMAEMFDMAGTSPLFEEIKNGEEIPFYELIIRDREDGTQVVEVERRKE